MEKLKTDIFPSGKWVPIYNEYNCSKFKTVEHRGKTCLVLDLVGLVESLEIKNCPSKFCLGVLGLY